MAVLFRALSRSRLLPPLQRLCIRTMTSDQGQVTSGHTEVIPNPDGYYPNLMLVNGSPLGIRRAKLADFDSILSLDATVGAFDAGDYLFGKLSMYLHDPARLVSVAEIDGRIIGFMMQRGIDAGTNQVGRIARVHRSMRGCGIWEALRYVTMVDCMMVWPNSRMYFGCTSSWHLPFFQITARWKEVFTRPYVHVTVDKMMNPKPPACPSNIRLQELSLDECYEILQDPSIRYKIFPTGMMVIGREPLTVHQINFQLMATECKSVQVTYDVTSGDPISLSFGSAFHSPQGYVYECDIFTASGDPEEIAQHVWGHISVAQRNCTEEILKITVFVQHSNGVDGLIDIMNSSENGASFQFSQVQNHVLGTVACKQYLQTCKSAFDKARQVKVKV